ncbi:hypothetical protein Q7C36_018794 [Tachysurus vachellii]|uniref:Uncharacterized protein n=1 Tax=Tachysurus vachellii TaxID=175792 RepID=A0AA88S7B6_TACVA|nr:hypothetical protein Q7C36_018794 [Tachysurus vachellii]
MWNKFGKRSSYGSKYVKTPFGHLSPCRLVRVRSTLADARWIITKYLRLINRPKSLRTPGEAPSSSWL